MIIILENELEKQAWQIMLEAHHKWEKNHGDSLRQMMDWYFFDLCHDKVKEIIEKEARKRMNEKWKHIINLETTLEEYLAECAEECKNDGVTRRELVEDYEHLRGKILWALEDEKVVIKEDLRNLYYSFFNAPESLTVIVKSQNKEEQKQGLLQKYYEMARHNLTCYSENCAMNKAKKGFDMEWKQAQIECELLQEMIAEMKAEER